MIKPGHRHIPSMPRIVSIRPLVEADLEQLRQVVGTKPKRVQALRDSHHTVARYLASGLTHAEIAEHTGYAIGSINRLAVDPSVRELVAKYREVLTEDWRDQQDHLTRLATNNMLKAERQLADKLDQADEDDETLPTRDLIRITSDRMDRFGYGKKSANLNINIDFAAQLEAAHARIRAHKLRELEE